MDADGIGLTRSRSFVGEPAASPPPDVPYTTMNSPCFTVVMVARQAAVAPRGAARVPTASGAPRGSGTSRGLPGSFHFN